MARTRITVLAITALLAACGSPKGGGTSGAGEVPTLEKHCYLLVTKHPPIAAGTDTFPSTPDSLYIRLDILGDLVNGVYDQLPGEQDPVTGSLQGTRDSNRVTALYTFNTEGQTGRKEVIFRVGDHGLQIGTGEMKNADGVLVFMDKATATFGDQVPEVDCP